MAFADWIGRVQTRTDTAMREPFARFNAMLDRDPEPAAEALPPMGHLLCFLADARQSDLGPDGHGARGDFLPPISLAMRMWAGSRIQFHAPIPFETLLTRRTTMSSVTEKAGRTGPLVFVTVRQEIFDGDRLCLTDDNDLVFRERSADGAPAPPGEQRKSDFTRVVTPTTTLLFRYSALTFNSHRIHYDRDYTRNVEGYPGLLVHGPLQATLLADHFRRAYPDAVLTKLSFRAQRPVYDLAPFTLNLAAGSVPTQFDLWAADSEGYVAMDAKAEIAT